MADEANDDIEEQRRLAKDWKPDVDGPLVGPVSSTANFTADFTEDDPRCSKIRNLTVEFPYYRSMKRDGSCGYRALAFGFLFSLCQPGSSDGGKDDISQDVRASRLRAAGDHFDALQKFFGPRGWDPFIYEDWLAACVGLCNDLATTVAAGGEGGGGKGGETGQKEEEDDVVQACSRLLSERLNDDQEAGVEVLQYLRAVTSSWMLAHEADFVPFVVDEPRGVQGWCELNVDPPSAEMEEQSLLAFYQAVVERTGIAVRVHYLEQSVGERLQVSSYEPAKKPDGPLPPAVHLLYRP